jgi:hypothetical protein
MTGEKKTQMTLNDLSIRRASTGSVRAGDAEAVKPDLDDNQFEIFKKGGDVVDFRTVSWPKASGIFLKGDDRLVHR